MIAETAVFVSFLQVAGFSLRREGEIAICPQENRKNWQHWLTVGIN
jgi:hypothetical protein